MAKAKPEPVVERTAADVMEEIAVGLETLAALFRELPEFSGAEETEEVVEEEPLVEEEVVPVAAKKGVAAKKTAKKKSPTFEELKEKMTDLLNTKGKEVVKSILSEFGVAKLVEIEETSYVDVMAKIDEAMVADEEGGEDDLFGE